MSEPVNMKSTLAAALVTLAAVQPALAEGRYGFRCTSVETVITVLPFDDVTMTSPKNTSSTYPSASHTFIIDADKGVWRERFLGSDSPPTPFTITKEYQGDALHFDKVQLLSVWLSGKYAGSYHGMWTEENPKGWKPGVKSVHSVEGTCEEVADIPDVDLPALSVADKAKKYLKAMTP